eukprot:scaffold514087_cov32-Prasinocladus_malaysianus.AAC.1
MFSLPPPSYIFAIISPASASTITFCSRYFWSAVPVVAFNLTDKARSYSYLRLVARLHVPCPTVPYRTASHRTVPPWTACDDLAVTCLQGLIRAVEATHAIRNDHTNTIAKMSTARAEAEHVSPLGLP